MPEHHDGPEVHDFWTGCVNEAEHQRQRHPPECDANKSPLDWMWLIAYLSTKAVQAEKYGDREKYLHHIITTAAACANWHAHAIKDIAPVPNEFKVQTTVKTSNYGLGDVHITVGDGLSLYILKLYDDDLYYIVCECDDEQVSPRFDDVDSAMGWAINYIRGKNESP